MTGGLFSDVKYLSLPLLVVTRAKNIWSIFAIIFSRWSGAKLHRIFVVWLQTNPTHRIDIKLESGWNQLTSSFSLSTWQVTLTLLLLTHRVQGSTPIPVRWNWDPTKNHKHFIYTICPISFCPNSPYFAFRSIQDPLVHHGHHFGRAVHSFCSIQTLLTNGIVSLAEESEAESLSAVYVNNSLVLIAFLTITLQRETGT